MNWANAPNCYPSSNVPSHVNNICCAPNENCRVDSSALRVPDYRHFDFTVLRILPLPRMFADLSYHTELPCISDDLPYRNELPCMPVELPCRVVEALSSTQCPEREFELSGAQERSSVADLCSVVHEAQKPMNNHVVQIIVTLMILNLPSMLIRPH